MKQSSEINLHSYSQLIFDKEGENIQWRKDNLFKKWCQEIWTVSCKSMKTENTFTQHIQINTKWLK